MLKQQYAAQEDDAIEHEALSNLFLHQRMACYTYTTKVRLLYETLAAIHTTIRLS